MTGRNEIIRPRSSAKEPVENFAIKKLFKLIKSQAVPQEIEEPKQKTCTVYDPMLEHQKSRRRLQT
jgi:hypothetical protein